MFDRHGKLYFEKQWLESQMAYAYQTTVQNISVHCFNEPAYTAIDEVFVPGASCFMLGHPYYGAMGKV